MYLIILVTSATQVRTDTDNENNLRSSYIRFLPSPTGIRPAAVQNASVVRKCEIVGYLGIWLII